jgi:polar amino acid transport system substrate-binding protein
MDSYAPNGKTIVGVDVDTIRILEAFLGIQLRPISVTFNSFIPALTSNRVDILAGDISDIPTRRTVADILDYMRTGASVVVPVGSKIRITSLASLCGLRIALESGAIVVQIAQAEQKVCRSVGKKPIMMLQYSSQTAGILAVTSGRADATLVPTLSASYIVSQANGRLKIDGPQVGPTSYAGWAFLKGSPLDAPLLAAFRAVYKDGQLKKVFDKYKLGALVSSPGINLAPK